MAQSRRASIAVNSGFGEPLDVGVIGGGPAGATAAKLLASWGLRVVIFARRPSRPSLAESLPPSCTRLLDRVGLREVVEGARFVRSTGNTVCWAAAPDGERERVELFAKGALGYQVSRNIFDALLLRAAERTGAAVVRDVTVSDVRLGIGTAEHRVCFGRRRGANEELRCRWILDCSGRSGLLARRGRRQAESGVRTIAVAALWEREGAWPIADDTHTVVESYGEGWGWSVPASPTRRCVALMVEPARTRGAGAGRLDVLYHEELRKTPQLARLVHGARLVEGPWARDASPYRAHRAAEEGSLLVGDAASFVDPLSSFGVKKALASAWLAAVAARTCLTNGAMRAAALSLFERRERLMYETLRRKAAELARTAEGAYGAGFWESRADLDTADGIDEPDVGVLRHDVDVLSAFEEIRRRPALHLSQRASTRRVEGPTVRDNRVVLEEQLAVSAFEAGIRYLRNIDLVTLAGLAPHHEHVPDLYDAYHRASRHAAPPPMPDFLGALSVLIGKGVLELA